jgi:hypothetical protein
MTIDRRKLKKLAESMRVWLTKEQDYIILERFGAEPHPHEWSEQDISVQIQNFLGCGEFVKSIQDNRKNDSTPLDDGIF